MDLKFINISQIMIFCRIITLCPNLKILTLSNISNIKDLVNSLKTINLKLFCEKIKELDISSNDFSQNIGALRELIGMFPKVKKLNLTGLGLAEDVVEIIGDISKSTNHLCLSMNGITADICKGLSFVFPKKLQNLVLSDNWLGMGGVWNLKKWFSEHGNQIKLLDLQNNKLFRDEHDSDYLAQLLNYTINLEELKLGSNSMDDSDLKILHDSISNLKSLKVLSLSTGLVTKESAHILLSILVHLKQLQTLDIFSNNLGDIGLSKLFDNLHLFPTIQTLIISGNKAKGECLSNLLDFAEKRYSGGLLKINMMGNPVIPKKREEFEKKLNEIRLKKLKFALDIKFKPKKNLPITKPY